MKDLKHLIYFESLLQDAHNDLVRQAQDEGDVCVGYTCYHMPEVLLNLDRAFSVRLRAPRTGSMDIATYYMSNSLCEYARALLERALEGGYKFLDCMAGVDACECMNRSMENMELNGAADENKKGFFWCNLDSPCHDNEAAVIHVTEQVTRKVLNPLHENYGIDISEASIKKAVEEHNEVCRLITEIGEYRKELNPRITGYEFHIITLCSYVCPKRLILPYLRETAEELKTREPDPKSRFRTRVVVVGSEIDDPDLIQLIEDSGAMVVADRFCYGSIPGRQEIHMDESEGHESFVNQIVRNYINTTLCVRHVEHKKVQYRLDTAERLYKEYHADGIICS